MAKIIKKWYMSYRKLLHKFFGERYFIKSIGQRYYLLDRNNLIDRHIDAFGKWEKELFDFFLPLLATFRMQIFLDIGSHWGLYSIEVALRPEFDDVQILAFEPDFINRSQLYGNLFLNKIERIKVYDFGLSEHEATVSFQRKEHNRGASQINDSGEHLIHVKPLDSVIKTKNARIGIKMDVEGHEAEALKGMSSLLQNNQCLLQIECHKENPVAFLLDHLGPNYRQIHSIGVDHYFSNDQEIIGLFDTRSQKN